VSRRPSGRIRCAAMLLLGLGVSPAAVEPAESPDGSAPAAALATDPAPPATAFPPDRDAPPLAAPAPADRAVVDRVLADADVATGRRPPGLGAYLSTLMRRLFGWIGGGIGRAASAVALAPVVVRVLAWSAAAVAVAALVAAVVALVRRRLRQSGAGGKEPPAADAPAGAPARGAAEWRAEVERRLAAGRIVEALAAVWAWLANALCGAAAEPSWTGGELLAHGRRPDLGPAVARLDAMTYGPRRPPAAEVRELVGGLDRGLGQAGGAGAAR